MITMLIQGHLHKVYVDNAIMAMSAGRLRMIKHNQNK